MYSNWQLAKKFLSYYIGSFNGKGHGMHSPFIFHFITRILNDKRHYTEYDTVEQLRRELIKDSTVLTIEDFGAGSSANKTNQRTVASIAKNAAKSAKFGQLLFRMIREYKPQFILELGTSLGITSSYLSLGNPSASLVTMEGSSQIARTAIKNFGQLHLQNYSVTEGNFDNTLQPVLDQLPRVDFAFVDGNHRQKPTEAYFYQLMAKTHNDSVLVFDDIHWSAEMEAAWETIKAHPDVRCTVDLFFIGIVFFRAEFKEKRDFQIRF